MTWSRIILQLAVGLLALADVAAQTWKNTTSGTWSTNSNWNGGPAPNSIGASATLGSIIAANSATISVVTTETIGSLTISNTGGSYTIGTSPGSGTLSFQTSSGNAAINTTAKTAAINSNIIVYSSTFALTASGTSNLNIAGNISQAYYSTLASLGTGTVTLSGSNSFVGGVNIAAGTLIAANNNALGAGGNYTIASGASFGLTGGVNINPSGAAYWSISGSGANNAGGIVNLAGSNTLSVGSGGNISLTGDTLINTNTGTLTINATLYPGSYNLTNEGAGKLILTNGFAGTGDLVQNGSGDMVVERTSQAYLGGIVANNGNIDIAATGTNILGTNLYVGGAGNTASITLQGSGELMDNNTYSVITGEKGTFNMNGYSQGLLSATMNGGSIVTSGGTLTLEATTAITTGSSAVGSTINGNVALSNGGVPTISVANGGAAADLTINGVLTASHGLTTTGGGNLLLSGSASNVTSGTVTVGSGEVTLAKTGGAQAISAGTSISINSGGTLLLAGSNQASNTDAVTMNGGTLSTNSGSNAFGAMTLTSNSTIDFLAAATTIGFASSAANAWSGTLTILGWVSSDYLYFGTSASGLTSAQVADISFNIGGVLVGAQILSDGRVVAAVPTPEAPAILGLLAVIGVVAFREISAFRRRKAPGSVNSPDPVIG